MCDKKGEYDLNMKKCPETLKFGHFLRFWVKIKQKIENFEVAEMQS